MTDIAENSPRDSAWRWVAVGAVIGGILAPVLAIIADPLIPARGWMYPEMLRQSFLPGVLLTRIFLAAVNDIVPFIELMGLQPMMREGGIVLWASVGAPGNAAIYGGLGYGLYRRRYGRVLPLVLVGVPVICLFLFLNLSGLFLMS